MADTRPQDTNTIQLEYATISARDQERIGEYLTYRRRFENADDATLNTELLQLVHVAQETDGHLVDATPRQFEGEPPGYARSIEKFLAYDDQRPV